jgi:outer membrane protein assembly factor BamB
MIRVSELKRVLCAVLVAAAMAGGTPVRAQAEDARAGGSPTVAATGAVISPTVEGNGLVALKENGKKMLAKAAWQANLPVYVTRIEVMGDLVFCPGIRTVVAGRGGGAQRTEEISAIDIKKGETRWTATLPSLAASAIATPLPGPLSLEKGDYEFYTAGLGVVRRERAASDTGARTMAWEALFDGEGGRRDNKGYGVTTRLTIAGDQVFTGGDVINQTSGGIGIMPMAPLTVHALSRETGKAQWDAEVDGRGRSAEVTAAGGKVFVRVDKTQNYGMPSPGPSRSNLVALNAVNGKEVWRTDEADVQQYPLTVEGQWVLTATDKGEVVARDAETGKEKWRRAISPDCDVGKSKIEAMVVGSARLSVLEGKVWVPVMRMPDNAQQTFGAFAIFELESGKQVGFCGGIARKVDTKAGTVLSLSIQNMPEVVGVYKGLVVVRTASECMAIDRSTLTVKWHLTAGGVGVGEGMLFVNLKVPPTGTPPTDLYAVPLDVAAGG